MLQILTIESINDQFVRLRFTQATAVDVLHGGRVYVRHTNQTGGLLLSKLHKILLKLLPGNATEAICPALTGTYLLNFKMMVVVSALQQASVSIYCQKY